MSWWFKFVFTASKGFEILLWHLLQVLSSSRLYHNVRFWGGRPSKICLFEWEEDGLSYVEFSGVEEAYWVQTFGQFWYSSDGERELLQIGGKSLNKCGNFDDRCTPCNSVCKFNRELGFANRSTSAAAVLQFSHAMQLSSTCSKRNCRKSITFYNCSHHAVQWRDACEKPI